MKILAAILLFNPDIARLQDNISNIINQVDGVLLIDNASKNHSELQQFSSNKTTIIYNRENLGLPKSFNNMIAFARKNAYNYLLILDQDSICQNNLIAEYKRNFSSKYVSYVPLLTHRNNDYNNHYKTQMHGATEVVDTSINSGTLLNLDILPQNILFDENFFIDCVDYDFFLRLKKKSLPTLRVNSAQLLIDLGNLKTHRLFGKVFFSNNYSPFRLEKQFEDRVKFLKKFPLEKFSREILVISLFSILMILLFEPNKLNKILAILKGTFRGCFSHMPKYSG